MMTAWENFPRHFFDFCLKIAEIWQKVVPIDEQKHAYVNQN